METTDLQFVNIDTANEEITRLAKQLGQATPKFIGNIWDANAKIQELEAEVAKRKTTPTAAAPVTPKPTTTTVVPPVQTTKKPEKELYGLSRSIAAATANKGKPVHTTKSDYKPRGLWAAVQANIEASEKKD
jgi:hypothetical protein